MEKIQIRPIGRLAQIADLLMIPVMYIISGTLHEVPQRTHRWNNQRLQPEQVRYLTNHMKVSCGGIASAKPRFGMRIPLFHIPILGGWKDYVALRPQNYNQEWHIGWITDDVIGITQIKINGPVRMLLGPRDVSFFGITPKGDQLILKEIARGRIKDNGPYAHVPLLWLVAHTLTRPVTRIVRGRFFFTTL